MVESLLWHTTVLVWVHHPQATLQDQYAQVIQLYVKPKMRSPFTGFTFMTNEPVTGPPHMSFTKPVATSTPFDIDKSYIASSL